MRTIADIHTEIEGLSEQRTELWNQLSRGRTEAVVAEIKEIDERLQALWDEHRAEAPAFASASARRSWRCGCA